MSEAESPLQRILVALNASPHSQAALDAAVRLATAFEAELKGLFIEDETLLRTAQLPFAKEVRAYTAPPKRLTDQRMQRQLRYQAEYAEHSLQYAAEQAEVAYDFETVQGQVTRELLRATAEVDLLVLGKTSTASSRRRLGSTSRTILSDASTSVLVLRESVSAQEPLLTYYDGSEAAAATLRLTVQIARRGGPRPLTVLLPPLDEDEVQRLQQEVHAAAPDLPLYVHPLTRAESNRLSVFVQRTDGLVILPAECDPLAQVPLKQFLYEIDRPLLVVRQPPSSGESARRTSSLHSKPSNVMDPIAHLSLSPDENAKLTPLEVLADFADATQGWVYLERASRHYAEQKEVPSLVLRHWREGTPSHVDVAFAADADDSDDVHLVILDAPDVEEDLSPELQADLLEVFLEALRDYLSDRPDHVTLHVERDRPNPTAQ